MAQAQIFIPGAKKDPVELINVGLGHLAAECHMKQSKGPGDDIGMLIDWITDSGGGSGFQPDKQTWLPAFADGPDLPEGRYWVGIDNNDPPRPRDLAKTRIYDGGWIELGDGNRWQVPREENLPRNMLRNGAGKTEYHPQEQFQRFCSECREWRQVLTGTVKIGGKETYDHLRNFIEQALMVNYRLTPEISDYLKLFSSGRQGTVHRAAFEIIRPDLTEVRDGSE